MTHYRRIRRSAEGAKALKIKRPSLKDVLIWVFVIGAVVLAAALLGSPQSD